MGCAYNEAQVRVTLFKKWIRRAHSQLGWTQVLPTLLSAPLLTMGPPPPPEALRPGDVKLVVFGEGRKAALKRTKSNSGAEISGRLFGVIYQEPTLAKAASLGRAPLSSPGRAWDSAAQLIDSNESLYFL